ncbi:Rieske [2Fe-2S] domain protein [Bordetella bronchiseptica MBORD678]|uniref:3-chlorobenzoate-3,4-dioxygenase oxygenase n=2 Tax=Bordetella bronchiseptica TaxID=518 RepID=A0A0H3LY18_BORBR|nr:3-chlorobenzoate-3,4-dioxygenase [Bordetella bronchiseptica]KCV50426.1 Rieske [2Fe-2S] domain protein [Bordetella bronchiseptica 3E44]KCV55122.1 Rieske [2Fe-2S] domain protein [Bordetella bronchiseptica 980]KDB61921.1 Rieske [2Fe-2S] domain protein [Bordetella bronchiseptica B18-5 (C3)]KDB68013.1 Rieske [2Fe-2S] domain protein [Bordetella bronchiseptica B20-10725633]KDB68128.1 Rieske [2Fe-2S] domain protein [Bordetella bronchiseptica A1-7]KDB78976.1 Rieske [2Fe-2S] domain protein [Bordetel
MLTKENNERLCRVGAGTPGSELFRSLWLPAVLSSQLPEGSRAPVRLRLLGEDLIAFRDGSGQVGITHAHCLHRGAPLFFGKVEERGIRCSYHGWLYGRDGQCLEMPSEKNSNLCQKMHLPAYQAQEKAGIVWIYMGAGPAPELPRFPWIDLPEKQRLASVWVQETNWMQGAEGEIDSSHVSTLHKSDQGVASDRVHRTYTYKDPRPELNVEETPIGFMSIARRRADERFYWRVTQWMAPMFSVIPSAAWPIGGRAWVPIDDENTYCWDFNYVLDGELPQAFLEFVERGISFPPEYRYGPFELNSGSIIDTWAPIRNRRNDYLVNREAQKGTSTTGIHGVNDQDRAMQEGMGRIADRTKEKLVSADLAIVMARRKVLDFMASPEALQKFRALVRDGTVFSMAPVDTVADTRELADFLKSLSYPAVPDAEAMQEQVPQ